MRWEFHGGESNGAHTAHAGGTARGNHAGGDHVVCAAGIRAYGDAGDRRGSRDFRGHHLQVLRHQQDILLAFIQAQAITQLPKVVLATHSDDEQRMRDIILERLRIWNDNRDLMRVIIGEALFNTELAAGLQATLAPFFQVLEEYFARRIEDGAFREVNPRLASRALIGYCWTYFLLWRTLLFPEMDQTESPPETVQEILDLFLKGVLKPAAREG